MKSISKKKSSTGRQEKELAPLKLGEEKTLYPQDYAPEQLERIKNKNPQNIAWSTFVCTEFTSLCPKTSQPDFAKIFINYIANDYLVESKSLKIYLFSFRNHGDFHEDCVQTICNDLVKLLKPKFLEVVGEFTPRGGIAIFPYSSASNGSKEFEQVRQHRLMNYAPGKWSMPLQRLY